MHATLQPALSVGRLVGRSVTLYLFYDFITLTSLLLPKWSGDLKSGLLINAEKVTSHPHRTCSAVTDALLGMIR